MSTVEHNRLNEENKDPIHPWRKWGPYLSERSWGTVREDYSWNGDAWSFFPFDDAHQKVYRWGEDGIAGFCDRYQIIAFSPAFWNGKDPILKERLFGLSSLQGNHGEDVKEYYYYLDGIPSHAYMKYLYKYPQAAFPYDLLKERNATRGATEREFELIDTGVFSENRYFDIFIEYAKATPEDICIKIQAFNRGPEKAPLHIIPQLWFRNQWSWWDIPLPEPIIRNLTHGQQEICLLADDENLLLPSNLPFEYRLGKRYLYASSGGKPIFTQNSNRTPDQSYFKNGFHRYLINNEPAINPEEIGTKSGIHYFFEEIPPNDSVTLYLRLTPQQISNPLKDIEEIIAQRKKEADDFYETIHPPKASSEERLIQRQAFAGMLWTKQFYYYDVNQWLKGDNSQFPPPTSRYNIRNTHWRHLNSMRILSMPDKWEYPWFAAWDLAFQCITFALIDVDFAKEQLWLLLFDQFQHPNGAIPAYEWEFSDLNPPVQAWAAYQIYKMEQQKTGVEDRDFLKRCYLKLMMNFSYWVNKVDSSGCNVFEGGFLGLDNITLVDRSKEIGGGATLKQSDGTGWMAMFCLYLMRISLELSKDDATYEGMATKFFQHFVYIAHAMHQRDNKNYKLWNEEDGFFYDVLLYPGGQFSKFKVRSLVGLIPLFAVEVISEEELDQFPVFKNDFFWFIKNRKILTRECTLPLIQDNKKLYLLTLLDEERLKKLLWYIWNPKEFRSEYGIRSLSKYHKDKPFFYKDQQVGYEPGESVYRMKGGNSNWRGPIWLPTNYLLLQSLKKYEPYFRNHLEIKIDHENAVSLNEMISSFAERQIDLFKLNSTGRRPFMGTFALADDAHFRDHLLFYEYFNADTGEGLGASHQTGWTGLIANLIDEFRA